MSTLTPDSALERITRSATDIRAWIVGELSRAMNVDPSQIDTAAPLDSLGVDSLAAMGITGALAGWLNRDLPATLMWDYTSIHAIAKGLADPEAAKTPTWPGVINLQPNGDRRPTFFFPGLGGHPVTFAGLASHLGNTQPCYGLTVPGLNGEEKPRTRVEDIAAAMLKNMRCVQPQGPYQLAGYSFGGLLAYETARQLEALGETVSMLAIYDAYTPDGRTVRPSWQRLALHAYLFATRPGRLQYLHDRLNRRRAVARAKMMELQAAMNIADDTHKTNVQYLAWVNTQAIEKYSPRSYAGSVLLFRATDRAIHDLFYRVDASGGWGAVAGGGVRVFDLPGNHLSMLSADNAFAAAEMLRPYLSDPPVS